MTIHLKSDATRLSAHKRSVKACRSTGLSNRAVPRSFLTPGLWLVLAAVVFWGLQSKLSLYRPNPGPSARAAVAKLWVEPRIAVASRSQDIRPHHELPIYPAEGLQGCRAIYIAFHSFGPPAKGSEPRVVSVLPRSPPPQRHHSFSSSVRYLEPRRLLLQYVKHLG